MSQTTNQATNQTDYLQQFDHITRHLTLDNGKPADAATVKRILAGTPMPTNTKSTLPNRGFNLMR